MRLTQLNLVVVLLLLCLIASDEAEASRKFLTGLIIGTLLGKLHVLRSLARIAGRLQATMTLT